MRETGGWRLTKCVGRHRLFCPTHNFFAHPLVNNGIPSPLLIALFHGRERHITSKVSPYWLGFWSTTLTTTIILVLNIVAIFPSQTCDLCPPGRARGRGWLVQRHSCQQRLLSRIYFPSPSKTFPKVKPWPCLEIGLKAAALWEIFEDQQPMQMHFFIKKLSCSCLCGFRTLALDVDPNIILYHQSSVCHIINFCWTLIRVLSLLFHQKLAGCVAVVALHQLIPPKSPALMCQLFRKWHWQKVPPIFHSNLTTQA